MRDRARHRVYMAVSRRSSSHEGKHKLWYLSEQQRHDVIWLLGAEYVIYGMDYPYNRMEENKMAIEFIMNMDITDEEKQLILGGNLKRALNI